jgi:hypothetical protein
MRTAKSGIEPATLAGLTKLEDFGFWDALKDVWETSTPLESKRASDCGRVSRARRFVLARMEDRSSRLRAPPRICPTGHSARETWELKL